jgi:hypothetical protein
MVSSWMLAESMTQSVSSKLAIASFQSLWLGRSFFNLSVNKQIFTFLGHGEIGDIGGAFAHGDHLFRDTG